MLQQRDTEQVVISRVSGHDPEYGELHRAECFTTQISTKGPVGFAYFVVITSRRGENAQVEIAVVQSLTTSDFCDNEAFLKNDVETQLTTAIRDKWPNCSDDRSREGLDFTPDSLLSDMSDRDIQISKVEQVPRFETDDEFFNLEQFEWWRIECFTDYQISPIGFGSLRKSDDGPPYLESLLVIPQLRRRGIATQMLEHIGSKWPDFSFNAVASEYWGKTSAEYKPVWQRLLDNKVLRKVNDAEQPAFQFVPRHRRNSYSLSGNT